MNTLIDCDEVFERLTRAPFPAPRNAADQAVLEHVAVCHECRCFAEALRPAVELLDDVANAGHHAANNLPQFTAELAPVLQRGQHPGATQEHAGRFWLATLAGMLVGVAIMLAYYAGGRGRNGSFAWLASTSDGASLQPTMLALAPLKLHDVCLRTRAAADATVKLVCCTECHAAGVQQFAAIDFSRLQLACAACHGE